VAQGRAIEVLAEQVWAKLSELRTHVAIQHLREEIAPQAEQSLWDRVEKVVEVRVSITKSAATPRCLFSPSAWRPVSIVFLFRQADARVTREKVKKAHVSRSSWLWTASTPYKSKRS
jgi:hypothetical protein